MQLQEKRPETLAGLFVLAGILILAILIVQFGNIKESFSDDYHVYVEFSDASGLIKGSEVRMGGAKIGSVKQVPTLTEKLNVRVDLSIDSRVPVYRGSEFQIQSLSLLGDKIVVIVPPEKRTEGARLSDGDMAQGVDNDGLLGLQSDASNAAKTAQKVLIKMDHMLENVELMVNDFRSTLDHINNDLLSQSNVESISSALTSMEQTADSFARASKDLEHGLKELPSTMVAVREVAENGDATFSSIQQKMTKIDPVIETLPSTVESYRILAEKLTILTESADLSLKQIRQGHGLLGSLVNDEDMGNDTKVFISNLKKHGLLGYKDTEQTEVEAAKDSRYRGLRR